MAETPALGSNGRIGIRMASRLKWTVALHLAWIPALLVAWFAIAGEYGNPVPDNWPVLERITDIIGASLQVYTKIKLYVNAAHPLAAGGCYISNTGNTIDGFLQWFGNL